MDTQNIKKPRPRKALRKKIKLTYGSIQCFAYNVEVSPATVSLACSGYTSVGKERAEKWAAALGAEIESIFPELAD